MVSAMISRPIVWYRICQSRMLNMAVRSVKSLVMLMRFSPSVSHVIPKLIDDLGRTTPSKISATPLQSKPMIRTVWIRVFPTITGQQPNPRSNQRWNEISHALNNGYRFVTKEKKPHTFGYLGECQLTELAFIDRGSSFMSDTLHSIYHGAFVSFTIRRELIDDLSCSISCRKSCSSSGRKDRRNKRGP